MIFEEGGNYLYKEEIPESVFNTQTEQYFYEKGYNRIELDSENRAWGIRDAILDEIKQYKKSIGNNSLMFDDLKDGEYFIFKDPRDTLSYELLSGDKFLHKKINRCAANFKYGRAIVWPEEEVIRVLTYES